MAQPFTREDQLGISLLTLDQLQTEEMQNKIQAKVQQELWHLLSNQRTGKYIPVISIQSIAKLVPTTEYLLHKNMQ